MRRMQDAQDRSSAEKRTSSPPVSSPKPAPSSPAASTGDTPPPGMDRTEEREWARRRVAEKKAQEEAEDRKISPRSKGDKKGGRTQEEIEAAAEKRLEKMTGSTYSAASPRSPATPLATSGKGAIGSPAANPDPPS